MIDHVFGNTVADTMHSSNMIDGVMFHGEPFVAEITFEWPDAQMRAIVSVYVVLASFDSDMAYIAHKVWCGGVVFTFRLHFITAHIMVHALQQHRTK